MRIVYIVPGLMPDAECRRREAMLRSWAAAGTQVDVACVTEGPNSIESLYEEFLAVPAAARLAVQKEREGYDAAIIGCAGDPGVDAIRELTTNMLVIGPGAASFLAAAMLGHRFGVLTPEGDMWQSSLELAFKTGVKDKLVAAVSIQTPVLEMMADKKVTMERILRAGRTAIAQKAVDTMVIGCMTMAFMDVAKEMEEALGIPVVNPAPVCLKYAEAMVACGLTHSKAAYPLPPKLQSGKAKSVSELFAVRQG